jgi:hypothetical protein
MFCIFCISVSEKRLSRKGKYVVFVYKKKEKKIFLFKGRREGETTQELKLSASLSGKLK